MKTILHLLLLAVTLAGAATSATAQPVITQQPRNQTNVAGTTAIFSVIATSTPPLSYQWRSYANSTQFTNIPDAIEATLTLTNVQPTPRRFAVVVTDGGGLSVTSSPLASLVVLTPPVITAGPTNESVFPGVPTLITLRVTATGTGPLQYQWMFNSPTSPIAGATNATLVLVNVQPAQFGDYFVSVSNTLGAVTSGSARIGRFWAPMTGTDIPALARFDTNMQSLMFKYGIPGGALAVVKDGRLVFTRGYGYANTNTEEVVQPDSLFRLASLSKAITATATLKLVEEGRLSLTNSAFGLLEYPTPTYPGSTNDPRLGSITVQNLLNHTGGWDRYAAPKPDGGFGQFDATYWFAKPAQDLGLQRPLSRSNLVQWIMGLPLQFSPGTDFEYSNVGYLVAGCLIEKVTGLTYEEYVRSILKPIGISRIRVTADSLETLHPGQVVNYDYLRAQENAYFARRGYEIPPGDASLVYVVPFSIREAAAGMIASPIDYLRFVTAIDRRPIPPDMLSAATLNQMFTPSAQSISAGSDYGMGWYINYPGPGDYEHDGLQIGARSHIFRLANGITFMYVVNFEPYNSDSFENDMDVVVTGSLAGITAWPTNDLFPVTLSYDAWRAQHFTAAELADPAISGDSGNPDGDDSVNLLEYATGTNPRSFTNDQPPTGSFVTVGGQRYFALTFRRLILGYELNYVVEASDDLVAWSPLTESVGAPHLNPDGTQTVTIRESTPADTTTKHFLRLRVSRQ